MHVHFSAQVVDFLGDVVVAVTVGIIVVVVLIRVGVVGILLGLAGHAVSADDGSLGVGNLNSGELFKVVGLVGRSEGTGLISEESEADVSSLGGTVGSEVVDEVVGIATEFVLGTLEVVFEGEGGVAIDVLVVVVTSSIVGGTHGNIHSVLLVAGAVAVCVGRLITVLVASVTVGRALVFLLLLLIGNINLEELHHVNDVFTVVLGTSGRETIVARVGRTEAEADEALGLDARVGE